MTKGGDGASMFDKLEDSGSRFLPSVKKQTPVSQQQKVRVAASKTKAITSKDQPIAL